MCPSCVCFAISVLRGGYILDRFDLRVVGFGVACPTDEQEVICSAGRLYAHRDANDFERRSN